MIKPYQKYGYWYVPHCEIQFVSETEAWEYITDS
nr:MAG TPA: Elongation factor P hydroxylase [Caudoviricetes sp.]